jgi:1-acyl-sn-glycerol-3-phosphate acyltransferase
VEDWVALARRRLTGDYQVDEFGFDQEYTERLLLPMFRPLVRQFCRVDWKGLENIPSSGPAVVVGNHAGTLPMDALVLKFGVLDAHPAHRHVRLLAADLTFRVPVVEAVARKMGTTLACDEDALRLLGSGEVVGVFPEGYRGTGKGWKNRYKLQRFGRGGFVEIALRTGAHIVPAAIVGSEEAYPMIHNARSVARLLGLPYFPITPTFPWLGPLGLLPLRSKWVIEFGKPIPTSGLGPDAWQDSMLVFELADQVRDTIQQTLYRNLLDREASPS